jgi:hypothetical protein
MPLPALLLTAALAAAPTIATDRECYVSGHDTIAITGSGFAPNAPVALSFTGNDEVLTSDATADATGALTTEVGAPTLADFRSDSSGIPVAVDTADGGAAGFELTDWTATIAGFSGSVRRGRSVRLETIGWIGQNTLYAHYVRGGRLAGSQRIGTTRGACGELAKRFKAFNFRGAKPGTYDVRISAAAKYDKRDRWIGFKRVKLAS